jgi:hypothetical protein
VLEDELGIRWADVHPGVRQDLTLLLPQRNRNESLFLRTDDGDTEYPLDHAAQVELSDVPPRRPGALRRGALHEAFALLFAQPFDQSAMVVATPEAASDAGVSREPATSGSSPRRKRIASAALAAGSLAAFVSAGVLQWRTDQLRANATSGTAQSTYNSELATRNAWTAGLTISGCALAIAAAGLLLWSRHADGAPSD